MPRALAREETFDREMSLPESQQILFDDMRACRAQSFIRDEENRQLMQVSRLSSTSAHHNKLILGGFKWIIHFSFILVLCAAVYAIATRPTWSESGTLRKLGPYVVSALELVKAVEPFLEQLSQIVEVARFIRRICSGVQDD
ncbi:hypothetical protein ARMSODRAFT_947579 [Armillaria solidipes]|uniref:Transmembrane protein n=1 Tax=Armillaria solidipes TaxID=1076256 RepID=A0A2H3C6C1_9AGAR|nr:hypothetical protein ARMSODRAFT_947579 [Armillaria solidipes]